MPGESETSRQRLGMIFQGWEGYQMSLVRALRPLTAEQLSWRAAKDRRSIGELARHISLGRITWFSRMDAPGISETAARVPAWFTDGDGAKHADEQSVRISDGAQMVQWLEWSWVPVQRVLEEWTAADLWRTYRHRFRGTNYDVSRQWTIWRIMAHDIHHGGQIAMMLAVCGIEAFELRALGGHIVEPLVAPGD